MSVDARARRPGAKSLDRVAIGLLKAEGVTGWLLVEMRPDDSVPSSDERQVLLKIAKPVARSVVITRTREARAGEHRRTVGLLHDAVSHLRSRLDRLEPPALQGTTAR